MDIEIYSLVTGSPASVGLFGCRRYTKADFESYTPFIYVFKVSKQCLVKRNCFHNRAMNEHMKQKGDTMKHCPAIVTENEMSPPAWLRLGRWLFQARGFSPVPLLLIMFFCCWQECEWDWFTWPIGLTLVGSGELMRLGRWVISANIREPVKTKSKQSSPTVPMHLPETRFIVEIF